jgi:hypothetical protein
MKLQYQLYCRNERGVVLPGIYGNEKYVTMSEPLEFEDENDEILLLELLWNRPGHRRFLEASEYDIETIFNDPAFQTMLYEQQKYLDQQQEEN